MVFCISRRIAAVGREPVRVAEFLEAGHGDLARIFRERPVPRARLEDLSAAARGLSAKHHEVEQ